MEKLDEQMKPEKYEQKGIIPKVIEEDINQNKEQTKIILKQIEEKLELPNGTLKFECDIENIFTQLINEPDAYRRYHDGHDKCSRMGTYIYKSYLEALYNSIINFLSRDPSCLTQLSKSFSQCNRIYFRFNSFCPSYNRILFHFPLATLFIECKLENFYSNLYQLGSTYFSIPISSPLPLSIEPSANDPVQLLPFSNTNKNTDSSSIA
eukprot:TRINITY_DN2595_c0_g1_i1.p1 TRINITY_DN2595_c0_g1~~TRINITY_DN2595_c0_g1_i1.p1  ORF type:complete len:228 (+),score=82.89 TRINITY_DN2595_c0_g1_i1:62-685(+)